MNVIFNPAIMNLVLVLSPVWIMLLAMIFMGEW